MLRFLPMASIATLITCLTLIFAIPSQAQVYPPNSWNWGDGSGLTMQPCGDDHWQGAYAIVYAYGGAYLHQYFANNFGFSGNALESAETHCLNSTTLYNVVWIARTDLRAACKFYGNTINNGVSSAIVADTSWGTNGSGCAWY